MITAASAAAAAALLATAPHGQTAPQTAPSPDITSSLNSGPPRPATYLAPEPAPATPAPAAATNPAPAPAPARPETATPAPAPTPARSTLASPTVSPAPAVAPARAAPAPARPAAGTPASSPTPARTTPAPARPSPTPAAPVAAPAAAPAAVETPPPPPSVPAVTVLDSAARAALPFTVDLPSGFEIVTGRPGPDFRIYTIRRAGRSFAMVYVGPASQFPIYSGEMIEAAGRASVVSTEDGVRHAREHLFQRPEATPREVHIWTMSLDGADRALAEQIAQSLDVR